MGVEYNHLGEERDSIKERKREKFCKGGERSNNSESSLGS
jgi:hypothetical protein